MASPITHPGKIFGIGLSKTGTTSLAAALSRLGIATIDMPYDPRTLAELQAGTFSLSILGRYRAMTDIPAAPYYAEFDRCYPGSRFILTVRDTDDWLRSLGAHWAFSEHWRRTNRDFRAFSDFIRAVVYGTIEFNPQRCARVYQLHEEQVRGYFKDRPDDLLVLDVCASEGYERLCPFLGLPVLDEPFPRSNRKEEKPERLAWIQRVDRALEAVAPLVGNGCSFAIADGGQLAGTELEYALNPREFACRYAPPGDADEVLAALDEARRGGTTKFALMFPCFWWFDAYPDLAAKLDSRFHCALKTDDIVVFDL